MELPETRPFERPRHFWPRLRIEASVANPSRTTTLARSIKSAGIPAFSRPSSRSGVARPHQYVSPSTSTAPAATVNAPSVLVTGASMPIRAARTSTAAKSTSLR